MRRISRRISILIVVPFVVAVQIVAARAAADDADTCVKGAGDERIATCVRAIKSARWQVLILYGPF
jgi:hypothetical protein